MEHLKFPIGHFEAPNPITAKHIRAWNATISAFPNLIKNKVAQASEKQLNTPYRPEGWTVRQVIHHCADSHMNSFCRLKITMTEDKPTIKPYIEHLWAEGVDHKMPVQSSVSILEGVHDRMATLIDSFNEEDVQRTFFHPESNQEYTLAEYIGVIDWHCRHHLAHIELVVK